jgi:hypothetical protein
MNTPPFKETSNRLRRPVDDKLASLLDGEKAVVRLVGPRRIGKTELVSSYAREKKAPILCVTIQPIPKDLAAGPVVLSILEREIDGLVHTSPKLGKAVAAIDRGNGKHETRREIKAKFSIPGDFGSVSAKSEKRHSIKAASAQEADAEIAAALHRLELAAMKVGIRPVVFFDEIQELLVNEDSGMPTVWAIRNEAQHHTACRYVFAGSNQQLFTKLQVGRQAPLLNLGSELLISPLTTAEIDAWAIPLFRKGGRHISTLAPATELLGGKIGEISEVCTMLWVNSSKGEVLDENAQREAVRAVARQEPELGRQIAELTEFQAAVLRWILMHPNVSPYSREAKASLELNDGTVARSLGALVGKELIESFSPNQYVATTPLKLLASMTPDLWTNG